MSMTFLDVQSEQLFESDIATLFEAGQRGDIDAYARLYKYIMLSNVLPFIKKKFNAVQISEWDDIYQDVFLCSWKIFLRVSDASKTNTWLASITRFHVLQKLAKDKKNKSKLVKKWSEDRDYYLSELYTEKKHGQEDKWSYLQLFKAIDNLSDNDRFLIEGHYFARMTYQELADILNVSPETIKYRHKQIKRKLRWQFEHESLIGVPPVLFDRLLHSIGDLPELPPEAAAGGGILSWISICAKGIVGLIGMIPLMMLWLTSVFLLGSKGMFHLAESVPHAAVRLWAIRRLFCGYCGVMLFPIIFFEASRFLSTLLPEKWASDLRLTIAIFSVLGMGVMTFVCYVLSTQTAYKKRLSAVQLKAPSDEETLIQKKSLLRLINTGEILVGFVILYFCLTSFLDLYSWPRYSIQFLFYHNWKDLVFGLVCMGGLHFFCCRFFRRLLLAQNNYSSEFCSDCRVKAFYGLTVAAMMLTLFIPTLRFLKSSYSLNDFLTFTVYFVAWGIFILWNRKHQRCVDILVMTLFLFFTIYVPRLFLYAFG